MVDKFVISRVYVLPETLSPNTMYIVKPKGSDRVTLTFTGNDPSDIGSILSIEDIDARIAYFVESAIESNRSVYLFDTLEQLHALEIGFSAFATVKNIFADDPDKLPQQGSYVFDPESNIWVTLATSGGGGSGYIDWSSLINGPVSTPDEIDAAVRDSHTHENKSVLDEIDVSNGRLTYKDVLVSQVDFSSDW